MHYTYIQLIEIVYRNAFDDESHDASSGSESDSSTDTDQRRRKRRHDDTEKMLKKKRRKASTESEVSDECNSLIYSSPTLLLKVGVVFKNYVAAQPAVLGT